MLLFRQGQSEGLILTTNKGGLKMIKWTATKEELFVMSDICDRAAKQIPQFTHNKRDLLMDLEAVHSNGCKLDLDVLHNFDDFDFYHDIYGIMNYLDRETGQLNNCFVPRCARG